MFKTFKCLVTFVIYEYQMGVKEWIGADWTCLLRKTVIKVVIIIVWFENKSNCYIFVRIWLINVACLYIKFQHTADITAAHTEYRDNTFINVEKWMT